ncbi:HAUS augmin-like complex subunit 7 [Acropora cervicornis]|uniref:HAUS augmin-like complex subunit 7 n=1 Tax=Acropora cervicornis TaxID=6130 RepID=A0AAD9R7R1_ACRCE|nr:HAUS augmin-like complex subunit 7 [Acropora cervicornis]
MAAIAGERLIHLRSRLEHLGCPYLDGVEDTWLEELLFKPGEPRLRLLQWALAKFDPTIYNMVENQQSESLGRNDSRIQKLLFASHLLGLCKSNDIEMIQGNRSKNKQAVFWENLLDIVSTVETPIRTTTSHNPRKKLFMLHAQVGTLHTLRMSITDFAKSLVLNCYKLMLCLMDAFSIFFSLAQSTLEDQFKNDCYFFDALCRQENLQDIFRSRVQLFPPDLMKATSGIELKKIPDEKQLISVTEKLAQELEEQSKQLDELRETAPLSNADAITVEKVSKTLSLSLTTMAQVVSGFLHCFETEMKPWCRRPVPSLSEVGPEFSRVHSLLLKYTEISSTRQSSKHSRVV